MSIHGTADPVVLYDGGLGVGQTTPIPPAVETVAKYATRAGCDPRPTRDAPAPGVARVRYRNCAKHAPVVQLSITGGGHPWPGGYQATHDKNVVPGARFSASAAILDFFASV
jgi:polyhydroxybutyrate depolymerase